MADLDGAEAEEPALQDCLVLKGTVFDTHYEVGQLPVGDGSSFCSAILVGEADERFVVCVPLAVWSKRVISRLLPAKALAKPIACKVEACNEESREVSENGKTLKVWVGLLSPELEKQLWILFGSNHQTMPSGLEIFQSPSFLQFLLLPKFCQRGLLTKAL